MSQDSFLLYPILYLYIANITDGNLFWVVKQMYSDFSQSPDPQPTLPSSRSTTNVGSVLQGESTHVECEMNGTSWSRIAWTISEHFWAPEGSLH